MTDMVMAYLMPDRAAYSEAKYKEVGRDDLERFRIKHDRDAMRDHLVDPSGIQSSIDRQYYRQPRT